MAARDRAHVWSLPHDDCPKYIHFSRRRLRASCRGVAPHCILAIAGRNNTVAAACDTFECLSRRSPCSNSSFHHKNATSPDCDADAMTHPFFTVRDEASYNGAEARESVEHMCEFDAHDNIFTMIAHDNTMLDAIDFFPKASANDWKQKGWREKVMWQFLRDFHEAVAEHVDNEARR